MPYYNNGEREIFLPEGEDPPSGYSEGRLSGGAASDRKTQYVTLPDGSRALIDSATGETIKEYPATQESTQPRNLGAGVFEDDQGYYVEKDVFIQDAQGGRREKRKTYITESEARNITDPPEQRQADPTAAGNLSARWAEFQRGVFESDRAYNLKVQENAAAQAQAQVEMDFLRQKADFAQSQDEKRLVMETENQIFNQQTTIATLQAQRQQMELTRAVQQAQMQQATDQFNASMQFNVQQGNQQAQAQKRSELAQSARDIAGFSESPTDWGKLAAFELANRGGGFATDEQQNFTTDRSLQPLASGLENRDQIQASPDNPYTFNPVSVPMLPGLGASPDIADILNNATSGSPGGYMDTGTPSAQDLLAQGIVPTADTASDFEDRRATGDEMRTYLGAKGAPDWALAKMEHGGMVEGAFIAGDSTDGKENEEVVIPDFPVQGQTFIIPKSKLTPKMKAHLAKFATGGVFDSGILAPQKITTQARAFQTQAAQRARAGTPWESGALPGYTFASSPGLDQSVIDLIASLRGVEYGEDPGYFMRQAAQRRPAGMAPQVVGRTA